MTPTQQADTVDAATVLGWTREPGDVTVIDVRTPAEFETAHIAGSFNVPMDLLSEHTSELAARLDRRVVLVCQSGARSDQARRRLAGAGADNLHVLTGGVPGFAAAGGEVVRGRSRWAMDRQVRLVAGALVVTSILLSLRLPAARLIGGGVGAGLTFSALTDSCAMGSLLSRLPYNRGPGRLSLDQVLDQLPGQRHAS